MSGHKNSGMLGNIALWGISGLGVVFFVMIMMGMDSGIDAGLYLTYLAFGIGILLAVLSGVMSLTQGGDIKSTLMPVGAFVVLFVISYVLADGSVKPEWNLSESASKLISTGLNMTGIAVLVAAGVAIYGGVKKIFN
ncbi:MAG: hypothetical protein IPO05_10080 [Flavobacteriales bacterium]|jgi:hypothetical protein|nr:hypothetical protein [Flavobacteriales bacterium]MBP7448721.1 hypothetical protein [Flavobacteriales bacterium]HOZ40454.1 hypothetical protein [Flavobacteriales bacterium]